MRSCQDEDGQGTAELNIGNERSILSSALSRCYEDNCDHFGAIPADNSFGDVRRNYEAISYFIPSYFIL